jgi:transcriptional regulator with PAS, ATPase and Fis domain
VPPLRVRRSDISLLVEYFVEELNSRGNKKIKGVTPNAMQLLINHNWPGNVRELKNIIEHSFILTKDEYINEQNFPGNILLTAEKEDKVSSFQENEKNFLTEVLGEYNWNKSRVAKKLNISRSTLYAKMKKYNLNHRDK